MKLGILMNNLGPTQLAYYAIINNNKKNDIDCILFYENQAKSCLPMNFATMQIYEAYTYEADIIATSISTAHKMLSFPSAKNKFFYVWDLEWMRIRNKNFNYLSNIYRNDKIHLIARSQSHKNIIEDCWNVKVCAVIDDCNISELVKVVKRWN